MSIQKIKSGRQTNTTAEQYIGALGTIFYNERIGDLRLGDGVTPGGIPLLLWNGGGYGDVPIATTSSLGVVIVGNSLAVDSTGLLSVDLSAVNQDIIPSQDATYSLGSPNFKWKDLHVSLGSIYLGDITLSAANGTLLITDPNAPTTLNPDPNTILRSVKDVNSYMSLSLQNTSAGPNASSDILLYNNLDPTTYFADFGIASSNYNYPGYQILSPNDTYLIGSGGDVKIGTAASGTDVVFFVGGTNDNNEIGRFTNQGLAINGSILFSNGTTFSGSYNQLTDKPTTFIGDYNDLTNKPSLFSGSYLDLTNKPTLFDGNYNDLTNKPTLFSGSFSDLTNVPSFFDGNYNNLINKPSLFDGNYNNLTNKPSIPTDVSQLSDIGHLLGNSSITIESQGVVISTNPHSINFEGALISATASGSDITVTMDPMVIGFQIDGGYPFSIYGGVDPIDAGII